MSKLKIGDEVKLRKKWIKITNTLDVIRDEENETKVGVPNNIDIKKTYEVFDIDVDGDVGIRLADEDELPTYFYSEALKKIKNEKD